MHLPLRDRLGRFAVAVGLIAALLLPAAAPVAAQTDNVLRVGTTQDLDSMNPMADRPGRRLRGLHASTTTCWSTSAPTWSPCRASPSRGSQSEDGLTWTFKIREGMTWSDGTPATAEDARWTLQFVLDGLASEEGFIGLGYIDPYAANAGITAVEAPDRRRSSSRPTVRTTRSSRCTSRSCPSTSGSRSGWPASPTSPTPDRGQPGRRLRPVPGRRVADRSVHPVREEPRLLEGRRRGRRGHHPDLLGRRRHHGPGAAHRRARLRPRRERRPVRRPRVRGEHRRPSPARRTAGPSSASTPTAPAPGTPSRTVVRRRRPCSTRRSAMRSATRSTRTRSSSGSWVATARPARPTSPPFQVKWHTEPADAADLRPRARQAEARRGRLRARRRTATAWTRKATRSTSGCTCRTPSRPIRTAPSSCRTGSPRSASASRPRRPSTAGR